MGLLKNITKAFSALTTPTPEANYWGGYWNHLGSISYTGEQTPGELGPVRDYHVDHDSLRLRSWQSFLENQITQGVLRKFNIWVIGSGLKLQSEPVRKIVNENVDLKDFTSDVEARFKLFTKSEHSDYTKKRNLNYLASVAQKNIDVSGDVLTVLRVDPKTSHLSVQLIDGIHVRTPLDLAIMSDANKRGNTINHGVEKNGKDQIVAYHVNTTKGSKRIKARDNMDRKVAFLVIGNEFRINNDRGIPLTSSTLEDLKMLDRYKKAVVGGAEERQKIAYAVEHELGGTGENPITSKSIKALTGNTGSTYNSYDLVDEGRIAETTQKTTINLPNGAKLKALSSDMESEFGEFYMTNINLFCAFIGIPPEVALSMYNSNFSASRAALKDWENSLMVKRSSISEQFYQPIFDYWLDLEVLSGRIKAPEYNQAILKKDQFMLSAYRNARFIGTGVPNIDPLKEVKAERAKLGPLADNIPLTTVEKATENVQGGEYDSNILQFDQEKEVFDSLDLEPEETEPEQNA
jgi:capsid protein